MNPRIHKVGNSFKGLASYLLHDKDAATSDRVAWVETHNLGTDNPNTAWKVMLATAMKQQELKRAAGIPAQGQKSKGTVLHYSLSWAEQEAEGLSREEMVRAAKASLAVYGVDPALFKAGAKNIPKRRQYADEHQAVIICHADEKHPHVHIMVNRVHPVHGCILPNGKDQEKLSRWALEYERSRGEVLAKNRERNWDMRDRGIWVKDTNHDPRHVWEMRQNELGEAANDNDSPALTRLKADQKAKNDALGEYGAQLAKSHREAWKALSEAHRERQTALRSAAAQQIKTAKQSSAERYRPQFVVMDKRHALEVDAFQSDEAGMRTKAGNIWESMKLLAKIRGENPDDLRIRDVFSPFAGAGARLDLLRRAQAQEKRTLELKQDHELSSEIRQIKGRQKDALSSNADRYATEKSDLVFTQDMETAALRAKWKDRNSEQRGVYAEFASKQDRRSALLDDYAKQALAAYDREAKADRGSDRDSDDSRER